MKFLIWLSAFVLLNVSRDLTLSNIHFLSKDFLLEIDGNAADAKFFGKKYGFSFVHEIMPGKYVFRKRHRKDWNKSTDLDPNSEVIQKFKVISFEQQPYLRRVHRDLTVHFNDAMWTSMWYINGEEDIPSMNIAEAWKAGYTGKGVNVAVIDNGVDAGHRELQSSYYGGYDFFDMDEDPYPTNGQSHGTKCAGVLTAAANNSECIIGTAFDANLIGIRVMDDRYGATPTGEAAALTYPFEDIDIYSNSWGVQDGKGFESPPQVVQNAIEQGIRSGRNGKGSIYVWAAGNGGPDDNCNCDGYVNSIYTVTVSGAGQDLRSALYGEFCSAILAVTYGSDESSFNVKSTVMDNGCENFYGTSANAPLAAGMIAMALQANPELTWRDVQHLIIKTAKRHTLKDGGWRINGVGRSVSHYFGYGLMDAVAMVKEAANWTLVPTVQNICISDENYPMGIIFLENRTFTDTIQSDGCSGSHDRSEVNFIEHVRVTISFNARAHKWVRLVLTSPSGTESILLSTRTLDTGSGTIEWTFMSVHYWGEDPRGAWKIKMEILHPTITGALLSWKLELHGTRTDPNSGRTSENASNSSNNRQEDSTTSDTSKTDIGINFLDFPDSDAVNNNADGTKDQARDSETVSNKAKGTNDPVLDNETVDNKVDGIDDQVHDSFLNNEDNKDKTFSRNGSTSLEVSDKSRDQSSYNQEHRLKRDHFEFERNCWKNIKTDQMSIILIITFLFLTVVLCFFSVTIHVCNSCDNEILPF